MNSADRDTQAGDEAARRAMPGTGGGDDRPAVTADDLYKIAEKKNQPTPIPSIGAKAIFEPLPRIAWTCEGLRIAPGGVTLFAGYGDSAKSIFVQYIVLCIVTGTPVFGIFPVQQGRVLHLDYEQGARLSRERYQRLARGMSIELGDLLDDALQLACFPDTYLDDKDAERVLRATVDATKPDVIAFDSFKAACPSTEENSSGARKPLDVLTRVCGDMRTALGIHHSRKPPQDGGRNKSTDPRMSIRGTGAIYDGVIGAYVLERERDDQDSPIKIHHVKERMRGRRLDTFGFRVVDVPNGSDPHWGLRVEHVEADTLKTTTTAPRDPKFEALCSAAFKFIVEANPPGAAVTRLMAQAKKGRTIINQAIAHLEKTEHIEGREEQRGRTSGTFYYPTEGTTEYTPPATSNGLGIESANTHTNGSAKSTADDDVDREIRESCS